LWTKKGFFPDTPGVCVWKKSYQESHSLSCSKIRKNIILKFPCVEMEYGGAPL